MPQAWLLLSAVVVAANFEQGVLALLPVYGTHYGIADIRMSALLSTMIAGNIAMQVPLGLLAERLTSRLVRFICVLLTLLGCALLPLLIETPLIWPCVFIWGAVSYGIYTMSIIELGERFTGSALVAGNAAFSLMWGVRRHRRAAAGRWRHGRDRRRRSADNVGRDLSAAGGCHGSASTDGLRQSRLMT